MQELSVEPAALETYAGVAETMAAQVAAAQVQAEAATPALLNPIFGLIGADFVAAFAAVQAAHVGTIARLAEVIGAVGTAAIGTERAYTGVDAGIGADVEAAGTTQLV